MANRFETFEQLLHQPIYFATFTRLSSALIEREPLAGWLSRGYYATLVAGALSRADLEAGGFRGAFETAELLRAFLEPGFFLGDHAVEDRKAVAAQVLPAATYAPQYALEDIKEVLDRAIVIFEKTPQWGLLPALTAAIFEAPDAALGRVGRSVVALWYCAALLDLDEKGAGYIVKTAPIQTYGSGVVWQAIGCNPPGLPGPYYGDWAYPPPQPVIAPESLDRGKSK